MSHTPETILKKPDASKRAVIADSLRKMAEALSPGERLPSVPQIRQHFGVAAGTVEAAMETLRREGLVVRRRGAGTFVARPAHRPSPVKAPSGILAVLASGKFPFVQHCLDQLSDQAPTRGLRVVCHYGRYENAPESALLTFA